MGKHVMVKTAHGYSADGVLQTVVPGDEKPDWVKNPAAYRELPDAPEAPESAAPVAPVAPVTVTQENHFAGDPSVIAEAVAEQMAPKKRGRPAKVAEKSLAEQAKALGIEVDPEWSEADIEARIAVAKG